MPRLFVNRLTVIDSAYLDPELGLVGASWILDLELEGALDHQGMILDFGLIKKTVKAYVDETFDHCLLVPRQHPGCHISERGEVIEVEFFYQPAGEPRKRILHRSPAEGIRLVPTTRISPETLAAQIAKDLRQTMPATVTELHIRLRNEAIDGASYCYSHGLKQHQGKCRRIAHGHRSRLGIFRNGQPAPELAAAWAAGWQNIYLANRADLLWSGDRDGLPYSRFGYSTPVGDFLLELPTERCALLLQDTTVENIAQHIADSLARQYPEDSFLIEAYEGLDKGAYA